MKVSFLRFVFCLFLVFGLKAAPIQAAQTRPIPVKPEHTRPPEVRIWQPDLRSFKNFKVGDPSNTGGGELASGDLDGDGNQEIVIGAGLGSEPNVRVYDQSGKLISTFLAYAKDFKGGVRVAVGDLNKDGKAEIVTATGPGVESKIEIFDLNGKRFLINGVPAYAKQFKGGVHVAVGDVNNDGLLEIITSPGPGGGPHIRIWNQYMENLGLDFFAFDASMREGVTISVARTSMGPMIVTGVESWAKPLIRLFSVMGGLRINNEFYAFDQTSRSGVRIAAIDLDGDGFDEIACTGNGGSSPETRFYSNQGTLLQKALLHDADYRGSLSLSSLRSASQQMLVISMPIAPVVVGPVDIDRLITVDLSEQRLYAYENGRIAKSYLISSGTALRPTPTGKTKVLKKIPIMDYRWSYGTNHPDNYFLRNVKFNLNIFPHIYIHSAYWHNNFGNRMSHGCINESLPDAEWLFNWATTGTAVEVHQ